MKVTCPKCESEDVQRLAMIYQHGTATSVSSSATLADVGGHLAVAGTQSAGKQQSLLAQQAAPPQPKRRAGGCLVVSLAFLLLFGPIMFAMGFEASNDEPMVTGGIMTVLGLILVASRRATNRAADEYNRTTYPRLKEEWERTWLCLRCGNRFEAKV